MNRTFGSLSTRITHTLDVNILNLVGHKITYKPVRTKSLEWYRRARSRPSLPITDAVDSRLYHPKQALPPSQQLQRLPTALGQSNPQYQIDSAAAAAAAGDPAPLRPSSGDLQPPGVGLKRSECHQQQMHHVSVKKIFTELHRLGKLKRSFEEALWTGRVGGPQTPLICNIIVWWGDAALAGAHFVSAGMMAPSNNYSV